MQSGSAVEVGAGRRSGRAAVERNGQAGWNPGLVSRVATRWRRPVFGASRASRRVSTRQTRGFAPQGPRWLFSNQALDRFQFLTGFREFPLRDQLPVTIEMLADLSDARVRLTGLSLRRRRGRSCRGLS